MKSKITIGALPVAAALLSLSAEIARAADLFDLNLNVITPQVANGSASFGTITDLINALQTQNLNNITNAYTQNSAAVATLNMRGLAATASFPANSTALNFTVPAAHVNITFNGVTRNDSETQLKNFLLQNGGGLATKVFQSFVANSPIDPVAGNPNSLQNMSARSDFSNATGIGIAASDLPDPPNGTTTGMTGPSSTFATLGRPMGGGNYISGFLTTGANGALIGQPNLVPLGGEVGFASSGGYTSTIVSLPFRYVIPFADPRYALTLDVPISYVNTAGASSYFGSFGAALRLPVLPNWYITPNVRFGASGSVDLGAGAMQYSGGIASRYDIFWNDLQFTIGNGITVAQTAPLSIGTVSVNYNLTNELFNNGVQVQGSLPYTIFGQPTSWQAYLIDTAVTGSAVYINHYDEIGVNVGTRHLMNTQNWNSLRVGVAVVVGEHYNAFKLQLSARF